MKSLKIILIGIFFASLLSNLSFAESSCTINNCDMVITIKIAFVGADDAYINKAKNEIESVWNGPAGSRISGDCNCKVTFKVETSKLNQANCTPAPAGYHCIMVTPFFNTSGQYDNPPRNQTNITGASIYIGYMYGVAKGNGNNSQQGWWSDQMSRPIPGAAAGDSFKDFAHEAGHMMGLGDGDGGIMSRTSGENSNPTQSNIDNAVSDICGPKSCPDKCCCGNGKVEKDKGEECDPGLYPSGCQGGSECSAYSCSCYAKVCDPSEYNFITEKDCESKCSDNLTCYKDYKSGCWECQKKGENLNETCLDPTNIRGNPKCEHPAYKLTDEQISKAILPLVGVLFTSERININISGMGEAYAIIENRKIVDHGLGTIENPTVIFMTDARSVADAIAGKLDPKSALKNGQLKIEGVGFFNGFRVWFFIFLFKTLEPQGPEYAPSQEEKMPDEYIKAVQTGNSAPSEQPGLGIGKLPDKPYTK